MPPTNSSSARSTRSSLARLDLEPVFTSNGPRVRFRFARVVDINRFALVDSLLSVSRGHADLARPARSDAFDARVVVADVVFSSRFPAGDALSRRTSVLHILASRVLRRDGPDRGRHFDRVEEWCRIDCSDALDASGRADSVVTTRDETEKERKKDDGDNVTGVARASTFRDEGDRYGGVNNDRKSGI